MNTYSFQVLMERIARSTIPWAIQQSEKFKRIETIKNVFSDHNEVKQEAINRKIQEKVQQIGNEPHF